MQLSQFLDLVQRVVCDPKMVSMGIFFQHGNNVGFPFFLYTLPLAFFSRFFLASSDFIT